MKDLTDFRKTVETGVDPRLISGGGSVSNGTATLVMVRGAFGPFVFSARKSYFALIFININIVRAKNKSTGTRTIININYLQWTMKGAGNRTCIMHCHGSVIELALISST